MKTTQVHHVTMSISICSKRRNWSVLAFLALKLDQIVDFDQQLNLVTTETFSIDDSGMPPVTVPSLKAEELDDLIYFARIGDLDALRSSISQLSNAHSSSAATIIEAAVDAEDDESGPSSECSLLHWPAANGNEEILSYLLSVLGSNQHLVEGTAQPVSSLVDHKNKNGNTPLHWAAVNGHISCVKALVAAGADPAITNDAGHDALYEADRSGKEGGEEVAEWILANCPGLEKGLDGKDVSAESAAEDGVEADDVMGDEPSGT
jgi:Ankyrin repeats (3 copies)